MIPDSQNNVYFTDFRQRHIGRIDAKTGEVKLFAIPTPASAPRRGMMDAQDRLWFGEYRGDRIAMFDTRTGQFREWKLATRWASPYDVTIDKNEEAWTGSMITDQVTRLDTQDRPDGRLPAAAHDQHPARVRRQLDHAGDLLGRQQPRRVDRQARAARLTYRQNDGAALPPECAPGQGDRQTVKKTVLTAAFFAAAIPFAQFAAAQTAAYPNKPVHVILPFPPGGSVDTVARLVMPRLSESLGQQFLVENRSGASGNIGTEYVARAAPDGYTLMVNTLPFVANSYMYAKLPFDPLTDFVPISLLASSPSVLVVHPSVPARSVRELLDLARAKPGVLNFATAGPGTNPHIAAELFNYLGKVKTVAIHYKGGGPALLSTVAGDTEIIVSGVSEATPVRRGGKIARARHHQPGALAGVSRHSDDRGVRPARLRIRHLARPARAQGNVRGDRGPAQRQCEEGRWRCPSRSIAFARSARTSSPARPRNSPPT